MSQSTTAPQAQKASEEQPHAPLPLPAPSQVEDAFKVDVNTASSYKFDSLGPLVVNSDGTLSRIANWPNMTPLERERTFRVLSARNQIRIAHQEAKQQHEGVQEEPSQ